LPLQHKQHSEATPTESQKAVTKKKHESPDHHVAKKPIRSEEYVRKDAAKEEQELEETDGNARETKPPNLQGHKSNASISKVQKPAKLTPLRDSKDLILPSDSNSTSEVDKRNSVIRVLGVDPESVDKPVEISVQSYTPPPNASAVIEVMPTISDSYHANVISYPDESLWTGYQWQPQETNGIQYWYLGQYQQSVPPGPPYVPTEEFLHTQIFSNNPVVYPKLLNKYPLKEITSGNPKTPPRSQQNRAQEIPSKLKNNHKKSSQPDTNYQSNYALNQPAQSLAYNVNTLPHIFPYFPTQTNILPYSLPDSKEIQNVLFTKNAPELNYYNPGILKFVTNSYRLQTHPKLEWVPL
jgi:hypothetical protein